MPKIKPTDEARLNHLLAAIPANEFTRLTEDLEPVSLKLGEVIYEAGEQLEFIYFPTTAIISLLYIMENGSTAEIGMAGNDGLVGIALYMGGSTTPNRALCEARGTPLDCVRPLFDQNLAWAVHFKIFCCGIRSI